jgi:hypothetical protein
MANPNLLNLTSIILENSAATLGTSSTTFLNCPSDKVLKIISVYLANKSAATVSATVIVNRNSTDYNLAYQVDIPPDSTLQLITKDAPVVLTESDTFSALASAATSIDLFLSYENMT